MDTLTVFLILPTLVILVFFAHRGRALETERDSLISERDSLISECERLISNCDRLAVKAVPILLDEMDAEYAVVQKTWGQWVIRPLNQDDVWGTYATLPLLIAGQNVHDGEPLSGYRIYDSGLGLGAQRLRVSPLKGVEMQNFRADFRRYRSEKVREVPSWVEHVRRGFYIPENVLMGDSATPQVITDEDDDS